MAKWEFEPVREDKRAISSDISIQKPSKTFQIPFPTLNRKINTNSKHKVRVST